jgi:hypothetical protein
VGQAYEVVRKNKRTKENKRSKEVEPNGHGEATHRYELHLHKLASINPMMVIP